MVSVGRFDRCRANTSATYSEACPFVSERVLAFGLEEAEASADGVGDAGDSP